jgi:hypothetical protein
MPSKQTNWTCHPFVVNAVVRLSSRVYSVFSRLLRLLTSPGSIRYFVEARRGPLFCQPVAIVISIRSAVNRNVLWPYRSPF